MNHGPVFFFIRPSDYRVIGEERRSVCSPEKTSGFRMTIINQLYDGFCNASHNVASRFYHPQLPVDGYVKENQIQQYYRLLSLKAKY